MAVFIKIFGASLKWLLCSTSTCIFTFVVLSVLILSYTAWQLLRRDCLIRLSWRKLCFQVVLIFFESTSDFILSSMNEPRCSFLVVFFLSWGPNSVSFELARTLYQCSLEAEQAVDFFFFLFFFFKCITFVFCNIPLV